MEDLQVKYFWVFESITTFMALTMLIMMIFRYNQLKDSAQHHQQIINQALKIRIILIISVITFTLPLAFLITSKSLLRSLTDGGVMLFEALILGSQIACLYYEYQKNVPLMWIHKAYWISLLMLDTAELTYMLILKNLAADQNQQYSTAAIIVVSIKWFALFSLVAYSLFVHSQDIYEYRSSPCFTLSVPDLPQLRTSLINAQTSQSMELSVLYFTPFFSPTHAAYQVNEHLICVTISKDFMVTTNLDGEVQCYLKLKVIMPDRTQDMKLRKTFQDFQNLETELLLEVERYPTNYPFTYPFHIPQQSNKMSFTGAARESDMIHKVSTLQSYMSTLTSKIEYYLPPLLNFLELNQRQRNIIETERVKNQTQQVNLTFDQGERDNSPFRDPAEITRKMSANTTLIYKKTFENQLLKPQLPSPVVVVPEDEEFKHEIEITKSDFVQNLEQSYLHYFDVNIISQKMIEDHVEYQIEIKYLRDKDSMKWLLWKRFGDFQLLDSKIKTFLHINKLPPLPKKKLKIQMDEKELNLRELGLQNYLKTILNEKIYLIKPVFEFIEFDTTKSPGFRLSSQDSIEDVSSFRAVSNGPIEIIEGKHQYTVYQYTIESLVTDDHNEFEYVTFRRIQKRYTDFEVLHYALKVHFQGIKEMPELPSKYNSFGIATTLQSREAGFTQYLDALFKTPNILDSLQFRRFIDWQNPHNSLHEQAKIEELQLSSDKNIDRPTSELINSLQERDELNSLKLDDLKQMYTKYISPNDKKR